jgi:tryptophan-rich sensory protein
VVEGPKPGCEYPVRWHRGKAFRFAAFMLLVPAAGLLIGALNIPGAWYAQLNKPSINPPNWVFAPVWTVLFLLIALAGFRTFERKAHGVAATLWSLQMALNFAWSPVFFSLHRIDLALAIILSMLAAIIAFVWCQWREDPTASLCFVPYAAWAGFAALLNAAIFLLN